MKQICKWRKTGATGTWGEFIATYELTQAEWNEKAKTLEVKKPYYRSNYSAGCGWTDVEYEMAMHEKVKLGTQTYYGVGHLCDDWEDRVYLLQGHTGKKVSHPFCMADWD